MFAHFRQRVLVAGVLDAPGSLGRQQGELKALELQPVPERSRFCGLPGDGLASFQLGPPTMTQFRSSCKEAKEAQEAKSPMARGSQLLGDSVID